MNTTGVEPALIVAPVADIGLKLPTCLSWWKKATPLEMSLGVPPSARFASMTPFSAALAAVGFPFSATAPLNFEVSNWLSEVMVPNLAS